jgi:hypothetical protein
MASPDFEKGIVRTQAIDNTGRPSRTGLGEIGSAAENLHTFPAGQSPAPDSDSG